MNWSTQKVLVTGAAGFIGSHLTEKLVLLGATTRALVHYHSAGSWGNLEHLSANVKGHVEVKMGDLCDATTLREALRGVDVVFHLAALVAIPYSYQAPLSYVRTNVEGTLNLLQAAREANTGLILHTSTSEVYGTALSVPINEDHPLQGQSPYSASKIAADKIAEAFYKSYDLPVITIRPFNTFGPRQSARAIIPTIITQCLSGKEIRLGNLTPTRDLNYVENTVNGYLQAAQSPAAVGQTFNLGSGREISIGDLVKMITTMMDRPMVIKQADERFRPKKSEVERLLADNKKARDVLGWNPTVSLEEGLKMTITWIKENLDQYKPSSYSV